MASPSPKTQILVIISAIAIGAAEGVLAMRSALGAVIALPLAFGTAGSVVWAALALDAMRRRQARPDRDDILTLGRLQAADHITLKAQAERLDRTEQAIALLAAEPALAEAETRLATAGRSVERWDAAAAALPHWIEARRQWSRIVARLEPAIVDDLAAVSDRELDAARNRVPVRHSLSTQDLTAAATYLALADRVEAARERWTAHRRRMADELLDRLTP